MSPELIGILGVGATLGLLIIGLAGLILKLSSGITQVSERVAKLEGQMQILITAVIPNGGMVFRTNVKPKEES